MLALVASKPTIHKDLKRDNPKYPNQKITLTLPIPISVNKMYYTGGKKGNRLTASAKQWKASVKKIAAMCVKAQGWKIDKESVWYVCDMDFYFNDTRRRDTHNTFKLLFDSLEGVLFRDDYYVKPRVYEVLYDKFNPRLELTLYPEPYKEGNYEAPEHILTTIQRQHDAIRTKK